MVSELGLLVAIIAIVIFVLIYIKRREYLSLYVIFMMLFLPKINIMSLSSGTSAGLRTDDLLILLFMIVICFVDKFKSCKTLFDTKVFKILYIYFIVSILSFFIGEISGYSFNTMLSAFTLIRKLEYFCFIFLGYDAVYYSKDKLKERVFRCLNIFTLFTAFILIFQVTALLGGFRFGKYDTSFLGRAVGTFNGPYEIGAFFVILMSIYLYEVLKGDVKDRINNLVYFILTLFIILFTKSRISLLSAMAIILIMVFVCSNKKFRITIVVCGLIGFVGLLFLLKFTNIPMLARFKSLSLTNLWNSFEYYVYHRSYDDYIYTLKNDINVEKYVLQTGDISFNVRIFKWMAMVDVFFKFPLLGFGFGANSVIDGNYIKLLAENGLIGTYLFIFALVAVLLQFKKNEFKDIYKWIIVSVLMGCIFIDLFDASKIMEFVWFWAGISIFQDSKSVYTNKDRQNLSKKII